MGAGARHGVASWAVRGLLCFFLACPVEAADELARHDYRLHCSGCHRGTGAGVPGHVPSLFDIRPFFALETGREYLIRVPGVAHAPIDDARLAALMNFVAREFGGGPVERPFSAAEVAQHRSAPLRQPEHFRARVMAELGISAGEETTLDAIAIGDSTPPVAPETTSHSTFPSQSPPTSHPLD